MQQHTRQFLHFLRQNRAYILTAFIILIFFFVLGIVSDTGQRIFSAVGITDSGMLTIITPEESTRVYIDDKFEKRSTQKNKTVEIGPLPTGKHSIIAAKSNHYPWTKTVDLNADENLTLRPFLISYTPQQMPIPSTNESYSRIIFALRSVDTPSIQSPTQSSDKTMAAWVEEGVIYASWIGDEGNRPSFFCPSDNSCLDTITVTPAKAPIKNLAFYKDRNDVIIISAQEGVYALEIAINNTQNFQPIYEGVDPRFVKTATNTIAVFDNNVLRQISL